MKNQIATLVTLQIDSKDEKLFREVYFHREKRVTSNPSFHIPLPQEEGLRVGNGVQFLHVPIYILETLKDKGISFSVIS